MQPEKQRELNEKKKLTEFKEVLVTIKCNRRTRMEGRKERGENIFKEIITENFPNLLKNINPHIQEVQQTPSRINSV